MQANMLAFSAIAQVNRPQVGDVAGLLRADTVLQGQGQEVALQKLRNATPQGAAGPGRTPAEVQRSQDQLARWGRALERLAAAAGAGRAAALIAGPASSATGAAVALPPGPGSGPYQNPHFGLAMQSGWGSPDTPERAESLVQDVATGEGGDAVTVIAGTVAGLDGGAGDDAISVLANVVAGVRGGDGDDMVSVDAVVGRREDFFDAHSMTRNAMTPTDLSERMGLVTGSRAQVDGGAGDDTLAIRVAATLGVTGGKGDDRIALQGGTVGLFYDIGDGHDRVSLAPGTEAVVQINGADFYAVEPGDDSLTLRIGAGSITFSGLSQSGAIGVQLGPGRGVVLLHPGRANLDRAV